MGARAAGADFGNSEAKIAQATIYSATNVNGWVRPRSHLLQVLRGMIGEFIVQDPIKENRLSRGEHHNPGGLSLARLLRTRFIF